MKREDLNVERWMNVVLTTAHELYDKLLNIGKSQYYKLRRAHKKRIKVQSMPENLPIGLYLAEDVNDLPPMFALEGEEEVKLEPEETVAVGIKLNSRKRTYRSRTKNVDSKQIINYTFNIISTNKSWKQFIRIKKWN